jgi:hypothetical protein
MPGRRARPGLTAQRKSKRQAIGTPKKQSRTYRGLRNAALLGQAGERLAESWVCQARPSKNSPNAAKKPSYHKFFGSVSSEGEPRAHVFSQTRGRTPEIFVNPHAEMLASFSTKGDDADGHKSTQTESRRIEGQAEEIYDLRRLRTAVEEKTRIEILFENSVF